MASCRALTLPTGTRSCRWAPAAQLPPQSYHRPLILPRCLGTGLCPRRRRHMAQGLRRCDQQAAQPTQHLSLAAHSRDLRHRSRYHIKPRISKRPPLGRPVRSRPLPCHRPEPHQPPPHFLPNRAPRRRLDLRRHPLPLAPRLRRPRHRPQRNHPPVHRRHLLRPPRLPIPTHPLLCQPPPPNPGVYSCCGRDSLWRDHRLEVPPRLGAVGPPLRLHRPRGLHLWRRHLPGAGGSPWRQG